MSDVLPEDHPERERLTDAAGKLRCDATGCAETHPITHEFLGEPSFAVGRWLGWIYIDLNRPDLMTRELRFCSVACAEWWLHWQCATRRKDFTALDLAIRNGRDELKARAAGLPSIAPTPPPTPSPEPRVTEENEDG